MMACRFHCSGVDGARLLMRMFKCVIYVSFFVMDVSGDMVSFLN